MKTINVSFTVGVIAFIALFSGCSAKSEVFGGHCDLLRFEGDQMLSRIQVLESVKSASSEKLRQEIWDAGYESQLEFFEWFKLHKSSFMVPASGDRATPEERQILQVVDKEAPSLGGLKMKGDFPKRLTIWSRV